MSTKVRRVYGYLAEFKNASQLYKAAEKVGMPASKSGIVTHRIRFMDWMTPWA
jgi:hypothetical protein